MELSNSAIVSAALFLAGISGALLAVLVLRVPLRRLFGPRVAYGMWALIPLAALGALLPMPVSPWGSPQAVTRWRARWRVPQDPKARQQVLGWPGDTLTLEHADHAS